MSFVKINPGVLYKEKNALYITKKIGKFLNEATHNGNFI